MVHRDSGVYSVELVRGSILSVVKHGTPYFVRTPTVVTAARGTVFFVSEDSPQQTTICICEGTIHISSLDQAEDFSAPHHAAVSWRMENNRTLKGPPGELDHSDEDVAALRAYEKH